MSMSDHWKKGSALLLIAGLLVLVASPAAAEEKKPNILVDLGRRRRPVEHLAYTFGLVGYRTPNIDRIANEGMMFTDYYGEQSCTAGRASFIMGQSVFRTGLSKVGLPGAELGMREEEPTIAALLKARGYATGPVRQEPPRRPGRAPADEPRLRRVLRQPLPPQRGGGAGERGLPEEPRVPQALRPARRHPLVGAARRHAEDRGHGSADEEAHGDGRRRDVRPRHRVHPRAARGRASPGSSGGTARGCTSART